MLPDVKLRLLYSDKGLRRFDLTDDMDVYNSILTSNTTSTDEYNNPEVIEQLFNDFIETTLIARRGFSLEEAIIITNLIEQIHYSDLFLNTPPNRGDPRSMPMNDGTTNEQDINVVGKFYMKNDDGSMRNYTKNDVVYYESKTYIATDSVGGWVPESQHPENKWMPIDLPDSSIDGDEF
jgi:hypothetical protein